MPIIRSTDAKCYLCGIILTKARPTELGKRSSMDTWTLDHIVSLHAGGQDHYDNRKPCCLRCNNAKGNLSLIQFIASVMIVDKPRALTTIANLLQQGLIEKHGDKIYTKLKTPNRR